MDMGYTLSRGLTVGANIGALLAVVGIFAGTVATGGMFAPILGMGGGAGLMGMGAELIAGALVGGGLGASAYIAGGALEHAFSSPASRQVEQEFQNSRGTAKSDGGRGFGLDFGLAETDERNVGFARQIEEERMRENMVDQEIGR